MVLRLDPRQPLVWRTPTSLQLGVDRPVVRLEGVTAAEEHLLAALVAGVTPSGLRMIAASVHADDECVDRILRACAPALTWSAKSRASWTVAVVGTGAIATATATALRTSGFTVTLSATAIPSVTQCDFAIVVAHFVVDPELLGLWLRRDIPHLAVVVGDAGVRVGPVIEPGIGPCLWCLERSHTDADPAWPAMASQLWGRRSPIDRGYISVEACAAIARIVMARQEAGPTAHAESLHLDAVTGVTTTARWSRHPECGCAALPETATADAGPNAAARIQPTTARAAAAPS